MSIRQRQTSVYLLGTSGESANGAGFCGVRSHGDSLFNRLGGIKRTGPGKGNGGASHDFINFTNAAALHGSDFVFI